MYKFDAYINGKFISTAKSLEIISPLTLKPAGSVASLKAKDIDNAFSSARDSFDSWRRLEDEARIGYVKKFASLMEENKKELAEIMNSEIAKPIDESIVEIERTIEYIKETILSWKEIQVEKMVIGKKENTITRIPLGVVLAISPFNYPVNLALSKIAPALIAGNAVVFKPATNGSLAGSYIAKLFSQTGMPKGVFNLVTGRGREIGDILTAHKEIDMITFTGSVGVGKRIDKAQHMIPLVLELGGNDAAWVREDADLDLAATQISKGAFGYGGQRCTAIKRVIVDESIKKTFIPKLMNKINEIEIPVLVSESAGEWVEKLIKDSKDRSDVFLLEGEINKNKIAKHVVETTADSLAWKEEAFGPLLPIMYVSSDEDAIKVMNDSNFGLQNSIFTKDIKFATSIAPFIESGSLNINAASSRGPDAFPFLGVKDSGFGIQGIAEALKSMTRVINIVNNK